MRFPGFSGNDENKAALSAAFSAGRFPHALALLGQAGTGRRTLAGILARALVCREPDPEQRPCGRCPSCVRAMAGSHPDVRIIEGSGATRSLGVDAVRGVIADAYRMPEEADHSVYILLLGTRTSEAAQNKLLKLIEEPPEGAVFLLICESAEQLLPTIRSRVQSYTLRPPPEAEAAALLRERKEVSEEEALRLAALCGGNVGRMLAEAEGGDAARAQQLAVQLAEGVLAPKGDMLWRAAAALPRDRGLFGETLARLALIFRDGCVLRAGGGEVGLLGGAPETADRLSGLPRDKLFSLPGLAEETREKLERNANLNLLAACLCQRLRED